MVLLILVSLALGLLALIVIKRVNTPSKRDELLKESLPKETTWIEDEYQRQIRKERVGKFIRYLIAYTFLTFMAFLVVFPFYWMFATSVKSAEEVGLFQPTIFPHEIHLENFAIAMKSASFGKYMINTLIVGVFSTLGTLITTVSCAYAFARLNFKGRDLMFAIFIGTMMIPGEMMVITNYITVCSANQLGWYNTYQAMIVPFWVSTYYIYLLRNTFKQIPNELYYAAKVDGTSDFKYLFKVMIPIASPTIITITILKMMGSWNSYIWPNLVTEGDMRLITNGLRQAFSSDNETTHLKMAATTVVTVPLLLVFIFFRKYIMKGVSRSGIKG